MMWRKEAMRNRVGLSGRQPDQSRRRNTTIDPLVEERGDDDPRDMRRRRRLVARGAVKRSGRDHDERRLYERRRPTMKNDGLANVGERRRRQWGGRRRVFLSCSGRLPACTRRLWSPDSRKRVTISPGAETRDRHDTLVDGLGLRWLNGIST